MRKLILLFLLPSLSSLVIFGQEQRKEATALEITESIKVDGILNEQVWAKTQEIFDFIQFGPERGKPASLKTIVKILYDDSFLYVGFLCYDPEPEKIAARITKRDEELKDDDAVCFFGKEKVQRGEIIINIFFTIFLQF